jgi:RNA polymerase sigma factor (sigma-70 family)
VEVMMDADHVLVEKLRARDEAAFVELIKRYNGYLLPLANYFVSDHSVAEEVVQEAWMAVLTGIDRFEERSSFKTWISRIVMNLARTRGVRESRIVAFSEFFDRETSGTEPAVDPDRFQGSTGDSGRSSDVIQKSNECLAISSRVNPGTSRAAPAASSAASDLPTNEICPIGKSQAREEK